MSNKRTVGWAIYRPAQGSLPERWIYTTQGSLYRRRSDALAKAEMLRRNKKVYELYRVNMFYEPDNET